MPLVRRQFLRLAAGAAGLFVLPRVACAQAYPSRPITMVVPFAAGGSTDVAARFVAERMSGALGQQVVIENVPGAGGTTGSIRAMRARPDGHTVLLGHMGTHAVAVPLYPNLAYNPEKDFEPVGLCVEFPLIIAVRKDFPAEDLRSFIAYARANPDKLNMAHGGVGSNAYNFGLVLNSMLGITPTLVPFGGTGPAANALIGRQVDYLITGIAELGVHIQAGSIRALAIGSRSRSQRFSQIPTAAEAGLPEFISIPWFALFAPKGTPQPVLDRLTDALDKALDDQQTNTRLVELGGDVPVRARRGQRPLAALVKDDIARWTPIIKSANLKAE